MNPYNINPHGVYFNGGFQEFNGYAYSNITSTFQTEDSPKQPKKSSSRPPRTLTTISTDTSTLSSSSTKTTTAQEQHNPKTSKKKSQEPAYRFAPYPSQFSSEMTPVPITWTRNKEDFNILVVPATSGKDSVNANTLPINLRRPPETSLHALGNFADLSFPYHTPTSEGIRSNVGIPYSYPDQVHSYASTTANRLGMTGPLSRHKAQNPSAHSSGIGDYLLRKMGWSPGVGIGARSNKADQEPLAAILDLKLDKKGFGLAGGAVESSTGAGKASTTTVDVKLSVAYLNDICFEQSWRFPTYHLTHESGPPHAKIFKYNIMLNGSQFEGDVGSTKKLAKANAARKCLKELKLIP